MIQFEDRFVRELPSDPNRVNTPRRVEEAAYSFVEPTPVQAPKLIIASEEMAELLGIEPRSLAEPPLLDLFSGNDVLPDMRPYAACYGGHQFGNWAGQLGDGRAIGLGEIVDREGVLQEIQIKGAGPTPYSRRADGRAVLRSTLREFICSEAMHHLGIPTTRALAFYATGEKIPRDIFYDGRVRLEPSAIITRVAPSFLRFGSFELPRSRKDLDLLRALTDFTLRHFFPDIEAPYGPDAYRAFVLEVARRTARMISEWMRVGFIHGVMNTDNMSILGLTIDYGPYGFVEDFDPSFTPNTTDAHGRRYAFGRQPSIGAFNLACLHHALLPLLGDSLSQEEIIDAYSEAFEAEYHTMLAQKLGFFRIDGGDDHVLVENLFELLRVSEIDMTLFFRRLAMVPVEDPLRTDDRLREIFMPAYYREEALMGEAGIAALRSFLDAWAHRVRIDGMEPLTRIERMNRSNPLYIPRNYLAQEAIDALEGEGDDSKLKRLFEVLKRPYEEQRGAEEFAKRRPEWARDRAGCSMLSCSS